MLTEISDADRLLVFTQESTGDTYRYRGVYELVSLEQRQKTAAPHRFEDQ